LKNYPSVDRYGKKASSLSELGASPRRLKPTKEEKTKIHKKKEKEGHAIHLDDAPRMLKCVERI